MDAEISKVSDKSEALGELTLAAARRRGTDDGWLAAFFEFWAHVIRRPELRSRFAELHARALEPLVAALEAYATELPDDPRKLTIALYAMQLGLSLERLTLPDLVDEQLGWRMGRLFLEDIANGSELSAEAVR
jgi:hypothetical protein